jgi:AcrR family transcriptional regulator
MPRTGRPREFERDAALDAAMRLFWAHGYEATSLDRLRTAMGGLSSASFYAAFRSKEQLFREAVRRYLDTHGRAVASLYDVSLPPREAIERALLASARMQTDESHPQGCMIVMSTATIAPDNTHLQTLLAAERAANRAAIAACIRRGIDDGELAPDIDSDSTAALFEALLVGLSTQARDGVPAAHIEGAIAGVMSVWDSLRRADPSRAPRTRQHRNRPAVGTGSAGRMDDGR